MWFHIIEDEAELRRIMGSLISVEGYKAACFEGVKAYLDFFSSPQYVTPAAILINSDLPDVKEGGLIRHIRQQAPFQKIVMVTAAPANIETARAELCYELIKPFEHEQLHFLLRGLVACTETYGVDPESFEHTECQFGLEHPCPFAAAT